MSGLHDDEHEWKSAIERSVDLARKRERIVSATTPGNSAWPEVWPQNSIDAYMEGQRKRDRDYNCTYLSDAHIQGGRAYGDKVARRDNPFAPSSVEGQEWDAGWMGESSAQYGLKSRLTHGPEHGIVADLEKRIKDLNFLADMNDEEIARLRGKIADHTAKLESLARAMVDDAKTIARLQAEIESLRRHRAGGYRVCVDSGWDD